jgi:hypothetical protein
MGHYFYPKPTRAFVGAIGVVLVGERFPLRVF